MAKVKAEVQCSAVQNKHKLLHYCIMQMFRLFHCAARLADRGPIPYIVHVAVAWEILCSRRKHHTVQLTMQLQTTTHKLPVPHTNYNVVGERLARNCVLRFLRFGRRRCGLQHTDM